MGMWRSLHPFISDTFTAAGQGRRQPRRKARDRRAADARKALKRNALLERFEERAMLSGAPVLISILANNGDVVYSPGTAGQTPVLNTSPHELDLAFSQGTVIDPTTLGGIQLVGAGGDSELNTADDVTITPGYVGIGATPNVVVMRFSQTLGDGPYQLTINGSGPNALEDTNADPFNSGNPGQPNQKIVFDIDTGPQVLSVVPQPVSYDATTGTLVQHANEIDVYFNKPIETLPTTINQLDPTLFQLIYTNGTATTTDDVAFNPQSVSFNAATNKATLLFSSPISTFATGSSGTFRLRIGDNQAVSGTSSGNTSVSNIVTPTTVSIPEPGSTFGDSGQPLLAPYTVALDGVGAQPHQIIQTTLGANAVNPNVYVPGGNSGLGVRTIPYQQHIDLSASPLGQPAFTDPPVPGQIPTYTYNFPTLYGQQNGTSLNNAITGPQMALTREIFQLWSNYLGVEFKETSNATLGAADFGIVTGVVQSVNPTAPAGTQAVAGPAPTSPVTNHGVPEYLAVMNDLVYSTESSYGGPWFTAAMQQIGRLLGLGYDGEGPPGTVMGPAGIDPATGNAPEPVYPSNTDILHGQYLYQPASDNVDMYKFTIDTAGTLNAETIAQRLTDANGNPTPSGLNSVLTLYGQTNVIQLPTNVAGLDGSTFTLNDGIHAPVTFEFDANNHSLTDGNTPIAYNTNDNANTIANDIANAVNGAAASLGLNASASVQYTQVTLSGPLTVTPASNGSQSQATFTLSRQVIARNDDYFGTDSFINMHLTPGVYYMAVTSTGNTQFNPAVAGSGSGGTTQGPYDLKLDFTHDPAILTDAGLSLLVSPAGAAAITDGYGFTLKDTDANGNPLSHTFVFYKNTAPPASPPAGQVSITIAAGATQAQVAQAMVSAINGAGFNSNDITAYTTGNGGVILGGGPLTRITGLTYGSAPISLQGSATRQPLVGNSDGTSGGAYNFWFNVDTTAIGTQPSTIFVDKSAPAGVTSVTIDQGLSLSNPTAPLYNNLAQAMQVAADRIVVPGVVDTSHLDGQKFIISDGVNQPVTFQFTAPGSTAAAGNVPVLFNTTDGATQLANDIYTAIVDNTNPLNVTPVYTSGSEVIDVRGAQFVDERQAPLLLAAPKIVRVLGSAGADNSLGVPLAATFVSTASAGQVAVGQTFAISSGTISATFEFAKPQAPVTAGKLADGNYAVLVPLGAGSQAIAAAMAAAINASPLATAGGGGMTATVSANAGAYTNGTAWWVTLSAAGQPTINAQSTPSIVSVSNAASYQLGQSQFGGTLADGGGLTVPQGVTVMVDAGAVIKMETANISVGVDSPNIDRSNSALQVLGTPSSSVFFTSFHDNSIGSVTDTVTAPAPGDWGGIVFGANADLEQQGSFLDTVNYARLSYGGGAVTLSGQPVVAAVSPIDIEGSRPTITHDTILLSRIAAISADPNSFAQTIFGSPAYDPATGVGLPISQAFVTDYQRAGPDISGNVLAMSQPGAQVLNAVAGTQILPGQTFLVTNPATGAAQNFEFVNSLQNPTITPGSKLADGNLAVLFSPGAAATRFVGAIPADTAQKVATSIAAAINAVAAAASSPLSGVTAGATGSQVSISGAGSVVPSTPNSFLAPAGGQLVDGETFVVTNLNTGAQTTFEFDTNGLVAIGHVAVAFTSKDTAATVAGEMAAAINKAGIGVAAFTAGANGNQVLLAGDNDFYFILTGSTGRLISIPAVPGNLIVNSTTFQIANSVTGSTNTFMYRLSTDTTPVPAGDVAVVYSLTDTAAQVASEIATAINNAGLGVYAVVSGTTVSLIEAPTGTFASPLSVNSNIVANAINGLYVRTQNLITQAQEMLSVDAVWTATDIPYVLSDNLVLQGNPGGPLDNVPRISGRLQIAPGVTVKLGNARIEADMGANLIAEGTASQPIVFTSLHDNSYGGGGTFATDGVPTSSAASSIGPAPGDWSGIYFGPTSRGSLDHTLLAYGGGASTIAGGSDSFDAIEIHQATVRIADSTLENNAAGLAGTPRGNLLGNDATVIYVVGAQPVIVNNVFENNQGATISIDANSFTTAIVPDPGRQTGPISRFTQFDTNRGPLVALNEIGNVTSNTGAINGMLVRGGTLNTPSVWDDTGIVYVVKSQIQVPDVDSVGGLMLESSPTASLVVKFSGATAGITATGTPLDTANRIGGSVNVLGTPNHPVILTSLGDETAGAGLTPAGRPNVYTDNGAAAILSGQILLPTVPYVANGTTISNDVDPNVVGHFQATPGPGGTLGVDGPLGLNFPIGVTAQGQTQLLINQNLVFDYFNVVNVLGKAPILLSNTTITQPPTLVSQDKVQSQGSFAGSNGTVNWTVTTSFQPGSTQMVNQVTFSTTATQGLGSLQLINYLDENALNNHSGNDLMYTEGTPGQPGFQVFTIDGTQRIGLSQSGAYATGTQLVNATYKGWAADSASNLLTNILKGTQNFTIAGSINTTNLPQTTDAQLGTVFGPSNPTTAFEWTVNSTSTTSTITTFLNEVVSPPAPPSGQWQGLTFDQFSNDTNIATVNEAEPAYNGGVGTDETPTTAQSLGTLAPNALAGNDTQRLGFTVNGAISPDHPADNDVYSFMAQPGTQLWMSLGQTSPGLDSVLELIDANGNALARSDNAAAEAANPGLLTASASSGGDGLTNNIAQPLAASTLLGGNYDPNNPTLSSTLYDPASQTYPGLRNMASTNPLDAGFRVTLPTLPGGTNSAGFQQYYVRVRSRGNDINNIQSGSSSGDYQLQIRLQEAAQIAGSSVQYADIRNAVNGITLIGLPAHSPLLGENGETSDPTHSTTASPANPFTPQPSPNAQDLGNLLSTDHNTISVSGSLAASQANPSLSTQVDWYKFELNYNLVNALQSGGAGTFATVFNVTYASGLSRPNATISVFDSTGKLIYIGRDSNVADNQAPPGTPNPLTDLTGGSLGSGDPFIGTAQLPAGGAGSSGSFSYFVAVSSDATLPLALDATFNAGSANTQVRLEPIDSVNRIAEDHIGSEGGDTAQPSSSLTTLFNSDGPINFNAPNFAGGGAGPVLLNSTPATYIDVAAGTTGAAMSGQTISVTYNGITKTFEFTTGTLAAGDTNSPIVVLPTDSPSTIASDAAQAINNAFSASVASIDAGSASRIDFAPQAVVTTSGAQLTAPKSAGPSQVQQVQALNTMATPYTLGNVVLFVSQGPTPVGTNPNVPGHLETVNPFTGALVSDEGVMGGVANLQGNGYQSIAMRNDGQLFGLTVGTADNTSGQYNLINTGNATATNQGGMGIATFVNQTTNPPVAQNVGVQVHALAFVQNGTTRQLFAIAGYQGVAGSPAFANGLYQLDPTTGAVLNPRANTTNPGPSILPAAILQPAGVSPPETITGLASIGGKLYAMTDKGGLYIINDPGGTPSLQFVASLAPATAGATFTSLTNGPPNVSGGAYANDFFAADSAGNLYAFNTSGAPQPVFFNNATHVALGATHVTGLAFSTLDYNLWHVTDAQANAPGHGINSAPDDSRNPQSANQPQAGNLSYYFGLESPTAAGTLVTSTNATTGINTTAQPGAANYATNPAVYGTYNLPGGAQGSLQTNSFSLSNYTAGDKPTLYFNYFLDTGLAQNGFKSSARVMVSTDNGLTWSEVATNNPATANYNSKLDPGAAAALGTRQNSQGSELPGFASASSNMPATTVNGQPAVDPRQQVQQLFDGTGAWREARVDLSNYAGQGNLLLRFDFSTSGSMGQGIPGDKFGKLNGDINGTYQTAAKSGQNNASPGFFVDDVTVGLAGRGEMVTESSGAGQLATAGTQFFQTPQPAASLNPPTQDLGGVGPYQLNIRGATPYAVTVSPSAPDISLVESFDVRDRLTDGFTIVAPAGSVLSNRATFQISDGTQHTVTFQFNNTALGGSVTPGNVAVNFTPTATAAQVAAAIAGAINTTGGANKLVGVTAGTVQNVINGVNKVTGNRVDLFGATNLSSTQALLGTLTVSAGNHTLIEGTQGNPTSQSTITITRSGSTAASLLVTVSASDVTGTPSVNAQFVDANGNPLGTTVTALIPAGQTSTTVTLQEIDQTYQLNNVTTPLADGPQQVTITATAANYGSNADFVDVVDDNNPAVVPTLSVGITSPVNGTIVETAGANAATGVVSRNTPANVPLVVSLISLDPASATVPATVTIPAGQTSVSFPINAVNDNVLRTQPVNVTIVASAVNFNPGSTSIAVQDSGNTNQVPLGTPAWQAEGPGPITGGRTTNVTTSAGNLTNPVSGPIAAVLAPPNQSSVLYVGAVNGGVWKTTNANDPNGPTWTPLTDSMPSLSISSLQFGTTSGQLDTTKLIAGIGHLSDFAGQGGTLAGLIVSTNGGLSWAPIVPQSGSLATPVGQNITAVAERDSIILAAVNNGATGGLLRSIDGGTTFVFVPASSGLNAGPISDLVGDPNDPNRFYAAVLGANGGIFTSDDAGGTWTNVTPIILQSGGALAMNAAPTLDTIRLANNGQAVYFGYERQTGAQTAALAGIFRSPATALSSATWVQMDTPTTTNQDGTTYGLNPEGGSDSNVPTANPIIHFSITTDPNNANIIYVGGDSLNVFPNSVGSVALTARLFRGNAALPAGSQFTPITDNFTANHSAPHSDSRAMAFLGNQLVEGDDGGVYTLTNPGTSSGAWTSLNGNLDVSEMYSVAYDTNTNTLIGGTQDTGTAEQNTAGGGTWTQVNQNNGGMVAVDNITLAAQGQSIRYTSSPYLGRANGDFIASTYDANNNLVTSTKPALVISATGQTLYQAEPNLPYVTTLALNAVNPKRLVIGGANSVYESLDGGQTLTALGVGGSANPLFGAAMAYGGYINGIANPNVLWVGANNQVLLRTQAGGALAPVAGYSGGNVRALAINPNNWQIAVVADSNGQVWYTTNAGLSFTNITGTLGTAGALQGLNGQAADLHSLAFVPSATTGLIYVGTQDGVYQYQTATPTAGWARYGASLPDVPVFSLQYVPSQQLLAVGTLGRGAFLINAIGGAGDVSITLNQQTVSDDYNAATGQGAVTGTVTRSGTFGSLPVMIVSSNPGVVPNTLVTIPDGQNTANFSIPVIDQVDANGDDIGIPRQTVILTPQAGGLNPTSGYVNISDDLPGIVNDDEPALTVSLPVSEMNPAKGTNSITGTVSVNFPLTHDLTVTLVSSDPQRGSVFQTAAGGNTVVIPAGATSATFTLAAVDQFVNDGQPQFVTITAVATTDQGLTVASNPGDGNGADNAAAGFAVKIDATQHLLSYNRVGDASVPRQQGQIVIQDNRISNSLDYAVQVQAATRAAPGNSPYPGVPINFQPLNTDRVAPGVTITSNLLVGGGQGGINLSGDTAVSPAATVPVARILNNTIYGASVPTGIGVHVGQGISPTILNNIFANLATGVSVDANSLVDPFSNQPVSVTPPVVEGSVYQNDGVNLTGTVQGNGDLFSIALSPTAPLFTNAARGDFYLAKGSQAIDSAINQLSQRNSFLFAQSMGIPPSPVAAPAYDLYGQLRTGDAEVNPSGVGSTLFKDRGAIERVDFTGPTSSLTMPADNSAADLNPAISIVHWIGQPLTSFAIQLNDLGVGIDNSTVNSGDFALYQNGMKLTAGIDYFFQFDTNTETVYLAPATGVWATGSQYTIYVDNGVHFDPLGSGTNGGIRDLAGNLLQPNQGTGAADAGFTEYNILLQSPGGDAPTIGVPGLQTVPENGVVPTSLVFSSLSTPPNPISLFNIDAPGDVVTATFSTTNGTVAVAGIVGSGASTMTFIDGGTVQIAGSGSSSLTLTGTVADITQVLSGAAAQAGLPAVPGLTFVPTLDYSGAAAINVSVTDPLLGVGGLTGTNAININVTPVNQPPVVSVPAGQQMNENAVTPLVFSTATGNPITISDVDGGGGVETVTLSTVNSVTNQVYGTVSLGTTVGVAITVGTGTQDTQVTFSGTLSALNTALNGLKFFSANNFFGTAQILITVNDNGNSLGLVNGAPQRGVPAIGKNTVSITVNQVNQPPYLIAPLPNVNVNESSQPIVIPINLGQYIADPGQNGTPPVQPPTLAIFGNNNPGLVNVSLNGNLLTLTIPAYTNGTATITILATNNNPGATHPSSQFNLNVTVNAQVFAPTANDDAYIYTPSTTGTPPVVSVDAIHGIFANDTDHNGQSLSAFVHQVPQYGSVALNPATGSFVYTLYQQYANFNGQDSFEYQLFDASYPVSQQPYVIGTAYLDSPAAAWVARLYTEVLGRTQHPADSDVNYWVGQLNQGVSRYQITQEFVDSFEYRAHHVAQLYLQYLNRPASANDLNYWVSVWANTGGPEAVQAGIIGSLELYYDAGGTPQAWVTSLYQNLLGRTPAPSEVAGWTNYIQANNLVQTNMLSKVVAGFVSSHEYHYYLLAGIPNNPAQPGWYQQYLNRPIDGPGGNAGASLMDQGVPQDSILANILASNEYYRSNVLYYGPGYVA